MIVGRPRLETEGILVLDRRRIANATSISSILTRVMIMIELDQAHARMIGLLEPIVILVGDAPQDGKLVKF